MDELIKAATALRDEFRNCLARAHTAKAASVLRNEDDLELDWRCAFFNAEWHYLQGVIETLEKKAKKE